MTWSHRVMKRTIGKETFYQIHEVYYVDGKRGWTENAVEAVGEDLDELRSDLERQMKATDKPVLDYETGEEL